MSITTKLFAVVALGACEFATEPPVAAPLHNTPAVVAPEPQPAAKPRELRNGRPACGNVPSRMATPPPPRPGCK